MGTSSFIDAKEPSKKDKEGTSSVKCKLRITLLFRTIALTLSILWQGKRGEEEIVDNELAQELCGGQVYYTN